jgi:cysteine synthase
MIRHSERPGPRAQRPDVTRGLLHLVGQTPLLELSRISEPGCARIWAKLEYRNPSASPTDHDRTTPRELLAQAGPAMAAFVAAVGTGGTLVRVAERLRRDAPGMRIVGVEPDTAAALSGDAPSFHVPKRFRRELVDEILTMSDDEAMAMARRLAREEAIFGGFLSGANVAAAVRVARDFPAHRAVVTVIPDHGLRYRSTDLDSVSDAG